MRTLTAVVIALVLLAVGAVTQERRPQDVALQAAIRTETVDGNLESAIKQFGDIAEKYKSDRATAATALLHLAGCYQKRGDAQARSIYERIVREFADQKEAAATARTRMDGNRVAAASAVMTYRRVWEDRPKALQVDTNGGVSPDGRYVTFVDWDSGNLMLHDLLTGVDRPLTDKGSWSDNDDFAESSAVSKDGARVAYAWWYDEKESCQLRVVELAGQGMPKPAVVLADATVDWIVPHDWSPDGRWVAVTLTRLDRTMELAVVDVKTGAVRSLKAIKNSNNSKLLFSPDGRLLAFDLVVGTPPSDDRDVFVTDVASGAETRVTRNPGRDAVMGWAPDGRVLFVSDRTGNDGLWAAQPAANAPVTLIKTDLSGIPLGVSATGQLFVGVQVGNRAIWVASMDFTTPKVTATPVNVSERFVGLNQWPDWSPDGKSLSYVTARNFVGRNPALTIQSIETGEVRELPARLANAHMHLWAPDGRSLVAQGIDQDRRQGIYRIDAWTGETTALVLSAKEGGFLFGPQLSRDGRLLYYLSRLQDGLSLVERDLVSGQERELRRGKSLTPPSISPDGRSLAFIEYDATTNSSAVMQLPLDGGEAREVIRVVEPHRFIGWISWVDDRQIIVNRRHLKEGVNTSLLMSLSGGESKPLDMLGHAWGRIRVHPDGKRVAYLAGELKSEVWVLENFLK